MYPPGIPILVPGERISPEVVSYLEEMTRLGAVVDGLDADQTISVIDGPAST